jgi:oligopeptide/dipeptide ABC transporter ATP-binding protein
MNSSKILLEVSNLRVWFPFRKGFLSNLFSREQTFIRAVDGISFHIEQGDMFCLAGETGCGKTTAAKAILRLVDVTSGRILFKNKDLLSLNEKGLKKMRKRIQIIFQNPYESLNPRMSIFDILSEPLKVNNLVDGEDKKRRKIEETLEIVGLPPTQFMKRYPHELSGGQRQRVAIAAAIIMKPELLVADEPVSMLDVSIRADILKLMLDLKTKLGLTYIFITHDLALARNVSDQIAIMYLGKFVEIGPTASVIDTPLHPYTKALISVVPVPDPKVKCDRTILKGAIPNPINTPSGCRFHPRCPCSMQTCWIEEPQLAEIGKGHFAACHRLNSQISNN